MIVNRNTRVLTVLCVLALLVSVLGTGMTARAADYEPLEVQFTYKHVFTTTDATVDSEFHYIVSAKDGAPLPAEADENGVFSFQGVAGTGEKDGDSTKFDLDGVLTFTFNRPGEYVYELKADLEQDGQKKDAERYSLVKRVTTVKFYIANEPGEGLKLRMLTAEDQDGIKPNDVVFDPAYVGPVTPPPTPTPKPTPTPVPIPTPTPKPVTPRTGDDRNVTVLVSLLMVSGVITTVSFLSARKQKGSEDDA